MLHNFLKRQYPFPFPKPQVDLKMHKDIIKPILLQYMLFFVNFLHFIQPDVLFLFILLHMHIHTKEQLITSQNGHYEK